MEWCHFEAAVVVGVSLCHPTTYQQVEVRWPVTTIGLDVGVVGIKAFVHQLLLRLTKHESQEQKMNRRKTESIPEYNLLPGTYGQRHQSLEYFIFFVKSML